MKNASPWLEECILSGISQTQPPSEWIFVDDHSSDHSASLVEKYANTYSFITLIPNSDRNIIPALQTALKNAGGEFIGRMDADDTMPNERLYLMRQALLGSPPKSIVTGLQRYFPRENLSEGYRKYESWINQRVLHKDHWQQIYRECPVASPNWMMRTSELKSVGGFDGLEYPEDYDLMFRLYRRGFQVIGLPEITLNWREHSKRTSRNSSLYSQKSFFKLKIKRFLQLDHNPAKELIIFGTGNKARLVSELLNASHIDHCFASLSSINDKINNRKVIYYRKIEELNSPQVLLAVYPGAEDRRKISEYLSSFNCWYRFL